jgi:hypothetical protein
VIVEDELRTSMVADGPTCEDELQPMLVANTASEELDDRNSSMLSQEEGLDDRNSSTLGQEEGSDNRNSSMLGRYPIVQTG